MFTLYIITFAVVVLFSAFGILFIGKTGIRDYIIAHAPKLVSQMFDCDFCLSFWTALCVSVVLALVLGSATILFMPLLSTPLTRLLI